MLDQLTEQSLKDDLTTKLRNAYKAYLAEHPSLDDSDLNDGWDDDALATLAAMAVFGQLEQQQAKTEIKSEPKRLLPAIPKKPNNTEVVVNQLFSSHRSNLELLLSHFYEETEPPASPNQNRCTRSRI